jgi:hypothetical protein
MPCQVWRAGCEGGRTLAVVAAGAVGVAVAVAVLVAGVHIAVVVAVGAALVDVACRRAPRHAQLCRMRSAAAIRSGAGREAMWTACLHCRTAFCSESIAQQGLAKTLSRKDRVCRACNVPRAPLVLPFVLPAFEMPLVLPLLLPLFWLPAAQDRVGLGHFSAPLGSTLLSFRACARPSVPGMYQHGLAGKQVHAYMPPVPSSCTGATRPRPHRSRCR